MLVSAMGKAARAIIILVVLPEIATSRRMVFLLKFRVAPGENAKRKPKSKIFKMNSLAVARDIFFVSSQRQCGRSDTWSSVKNGVPVAIRNP
jgi:hypothetical protein